MVVAPGSDGGRDPCHVPRVRDVPRPRATLHARDAGTEVVVHVSGLHDGDYYWLWLTGDDGDRIGAGTFQGSARAEDLTMTAALPLDEARRVWVTDAEDRVVLDTRI